jgi:hypothetical protein
VERVSTLKLLLEVIAVLVELIGAILALFAGLRKRGKSGPDQTPQPTGHAMCAPLSFSAPSRVNRSWGWVFGPQRPMLEGPIS